MLLIQLLRACNQQFSTVMNPSRSGVRSETMLINIVNFSKIAGGILKSPRRVTSCGFQTGLTVLVKPMIEDYHSTFFSSYGIRVSCWCADLDLGAS